MRWLKLGRVFDPERLANERLVGAMLPVAEVLDATTGRVRVYFSARDEMNRSQVRSFDFTVPEARSVTNLSTTLLAPGKRGAFDDAGVTLGSLARANGATWLFYTGWNLTVSVPFNNSIGVAELRDGALSRPGDGPVMTRTLHEPYSCASPFVLYDEGRFRMWYASMDKWETGADGSVRHHYNIKFAESRDGITWERRGRVAIDYCQQEYAFGRPCVVKDADRYRMWYAVRGEAYRIGYAESGDGVQWTRKDALAGIDVSESGWDAEMIEYPFVFDVAGRRYMLYNGNGYGRTGIGLAVLDADFPERP